MGTSTSKNVVTTSITFIFVWFWCLTIVSATSKQCGNNGAIFGNQVVVSKSANSAWSVAAGDLNNDGWMDIASASAGDNKIAWYSNTKGKSWSGERDVSTNAISANKVVVADFNNDGALDLASSSQMDNKIAWYNNTDGNGNFSQEIVVATNAFGAKSVAVGDFDSDGWQDLTAAFTNYIVWYKNFNGTHFSEQKIVYKERSVLSGMFSLCVMVGDFNNDGWSDIVSATDTTIAWHPNMDGKGKFGQPHIVSYSAPWAYSLAVGDLNGDGWMDIASGSLIDSKIAWYENMQGTFNITDQHVVSRAASGAYGITLGDLNNDSSLDIISASGDSVLWYMNKNGTGTFSDEKIVTVNTRNAQDVTVGDFTKNGFLDIASASQGDSKVAMYKNFGSCCPASYVERLFPNQGSGGDCSYCQSCPEGTHADAIQKTCQVNEDLTVLIIVVTAFTILVIFIVFVGIRNQNLKNDKAKIKTNFDQALLDAKAKAKDPLQQESFIIDPKEIHIHKEICAGGNGCVNKATWLSKNTVLAVKEIHAYEARVDEFKTEVRMLAKLQHPNIVRIYGVCIKPAEMCKCVEPPNICNDHKEHHYMVIEFARHGSLKGIINTAKSKIQLPFTKVQALKWALQISSGIAFLHSRRTIHRDIKPDNILLNDAYKAVIADFGTVRHVGSEGSEGYTLRSQGKEEQDANGKKNDVENQMCSYTFPVGTPEYMAPEQFGSSYSYAVDAWAFGITLTELFTLKDPYGNEHLLGESTIQRKIALNKLMDGIKGKILRPIQVAPNDVPEPDVLNIINQCLDADPKKRPTFKQIERRLKKSLKKCDASAVNSLDRNIQSRPGTGRRYRAQYEHHPETKEAATTVVEEKGNSKPSSSTPLLGPQNNYTTGMPSITSSMNSSVPSTCSEEGSLLGNDPHTWNTSSFTSSMNSSGWND